MNAHTIAGSLIDKLFLQTFALRSSRVFVDNAIENERKENSTMKWNSLWLLAGSTALWDINPTDGAQQKWSNWTRKKGYVKQLSFWYINS